MQSTRLSTENSNKSNRDDTEKELQSHKRNKRKKTTTKTTRNKQETKGTERWAGTKLDTVRLRPTIPLLIIQSNFGEELQVEAGLPSLMHSRHKSCFWWERQRHRATRTLLCYCNNSVILQLGKHSLASLRHGTQDISTKHTAHWSFTWLSTGCVIAKSTGGTTNARLLGFSCESTAKRMKICAYQPCVEQPAVLSLSLIQSIHSHFTRPTDTQQGQILLFHFSSDQLLHACREPRASGGLGISG